MSTRTWRPYGGSGFLLARDGEPDQGPAIRGYARPCDEAATWEVTAESPHGACTLDHGAADDVAEARELAEAALERVLDGAVAS